ncbi:hypothetical protein M8C21_016017 [Ambrosia artemisiifolia]|uniref:Uncharacterized protein n=1 Tax=Ambrosia artemisiifolia TaxID=4212 RepID=A0AAD5GQF7_AMBAR|nr:hypothetical protein M8C21_016017 [Ambrosia artemisiifolia]
MRTRVIALNLQQEFRNLINQLKHDYENRIKELLVQINSTKISCAHRNHVEALAKRLDQRIRDTRFRRLSYDGTWRENDLNRKLQSIEKKLPISRIKLAENKKDLSSNRHVETLKQKVMKLQKENEIRIPA